MSDLRAAIDGDNEIQVGSLGFYKEDQLKERFPDCEVVIFKNSKIPDSYVQGHYKAIGPVDSCELELKDIAIIESIEDAKVPEYLVELLAIKKDTLTGELKTVVTYLQARHGKL